MKKIKKESLVLYFSLFIMASCGISYEYTFSKISSDILGNSVKQWAIIIGLMMLFMGIGSDFQKYFSNKKMLDKFIFMEMILGLIGGFGSIGLLYIFGVSRDHFLLVHYFIIISVGFLIGLEIPLLSRINEQYTKELKFNIGNILKMDYIGSFAGALIWTFILPKFFSLIETSFFLGILNLLVSLITLVYFRKIIKSFKLFALGITLCIILLSYGFINSNNWTIYAEQKLFQDKIVFAKTSKYQHIVITKNNQNFYCYINGNLQFSSKDEHIYHEMLVHPAMNLAYRRDKVLILGGGDGLALREILKYQDVKEVTLVDLDPMMTDLAKNDPLFKKLNSSSLNDSRVKIIKNNYLVDETNEEVIRIKNKLNKEQADIKVNVVNLDAYKFLSQIDDLYDLVIIDFPDPNNLELAKLYSAGFYTNLYKKLTKYGVIVQQSTSPIHAKEAFLCIGRTINSSGFNAAAYHTYIPSFGDWGFWLGVKSEYIADKTVWKSKIEALENFKVPTKFLDQKVLKASLVFGKNSLKTKNQDINTITTNNVFHYYEKAWQDAQ